MLLEVIYLRQVELISYLSIGKVPSKIRKTRKLGGSPSSVQEDWNTIINWMIEHLSKNDSNIIRADLIEHDSFGSTDKNLLKDWSKVRDYVIQNIPEDESKSLLRYLMNQASFVHGARTIHRSLFHFLCDKENAQLAPYMILYRYINSRSLYLQDEDGNTPLHLALKQNKLPEIFRSIIDNFFLLESAWKVKNRNGDTPLHTMCRYQNDVPLLEFVGSLPFIKDSIAGIRNSVHQFPRNLLVRSHFNDEDWKYIHDELLKPCVKKRLVYDVPHILSPTRASSPFTMTTHSSYVSATPEPPVNNVPSPSMTPTSKLRVLSPQRASPTFTHSDYVEATPTYERKIRKTSSTTKSLSATPVNK